jgi:hypothetical protein
MFSSEMLAGRGRGNRYEWGTSKEASKQGREGAACRRQAGMAQKGGLYES